MELLYKIRRTWNGVTSGTGIALQALWSNKLRASLTALGIIIGVTTVIGIFSIINGLDSAVEKEMEMMGTRTFYVSHMPWHSHHDWFKYRNRMPFNDWQYRRLSELVFFADAIAPTVSEHIKVVRGDEQVNDVSVTGTNSEYLEVGGREIERGRFFSSADVEHNRREVVLGAEVAMKLFGRIDPLMKMVTIGGERYTVIGILKAMGSFLGRSRDAVAIVPIGCFNRAWGREHGMTIAVKIRDGMDMEEAKEELRGAIRRVRGLRPSQAEDFSIIEQKMLGDLYENVTGNLYLVFVGVSLISLLVGGIGIMNIMMVSVTERTREIGLRKALGARQRTILGQFLVESLVLSSLGGVCGITLGFFLAYVINAISPLPASPSVFAVFAGLFFSSFVGLIFGVYPAYRASRLDPIVALRYE